MSWLVAKTRCQRSGTSASPRQEPRNAIVFMSSSE
jgi:hypothetical protein